MIIKETGGRELDKHLNWYYYVPALIRMVNIAMYRLSLMYIGQQGFSFCLGREVSRWHAHVTSYSYSYSLFSP